MFSNGEVNPLNVSGLRKLTHCPPHFQQFKFDLRTKEKTITDWIYQHMEGRFWIGDTYTRNHSGTIDMQKAVAFELESEVTYFGLLIDNINVTDFSLY